MLTLPAELTLLQARECQERLLAQIAAETGSVVVADAQALQRFDSAALAVLLACRRAAGAAGKTFVVQGWPQQLQQLARLYGIQSLLEPAA